MTEAADAVAEYDFIVVGAGSAGAVVAARLATGDATVLLLEAGPRDKSPWIHLPLGFSKTFRNPALNWMYDSDPEPNLGGRRIFWPRGKVLGGSSSINGLIWLRGLPSDYDRWRDAGNPGWSADEVMPVFGRIERVGAGDGPARSAASPLGLSFPSWRTELSEAFIEAGVHEAGLRRNDGFNAGQQLGAGYFLHTQHRGRRTSSATAYLRPADPASRLTIATGALAHRVGIERGRARTVTYGVGRRVVTVRARREIILSCGAINTPQLLQLSGIGPAEVLRRADVALVHALPGVGLDFHDHFSTRVTLQTDFAKCTLNGVAASLSGKARLGAEWMLRKSGPLTIGAGVAGAYLRVSADAVEPDVQVILVPFKTDRLYRHLTADAGFQLIVTASRPSSRGRLEIRSGDPAEPPSMFANYLDSDADKRLAIAGLKAARALLQAPPIRPFVAGEVAPGAAKRTEEELLSYAVETGSSTQHHAGSCRMGDDVTAVVDARLRVRGLDGLRVADASVMPQVVSANTNAACFMIGERCADFVRADHADCFPPPPREAYSPPPPR